MNIKSLCFHLTIYLFTSTALAWREVGNGGGLTEQNLTYLAQNFSKIIQPRVDSDLDFLKKFEKIEIVNFGSVLNNKILLRFDNKKSLKKTPFFIKDYEWWIQTLYLKTYDLDSNDELSWSESVVLLYDIYSASGLSVLSIEKQKNLRLKLAEIYTAGFVQEIIPIGNDNILQTTSVYSNNTEQLEYIMQVDDSKPFSLSTEIQPQLGCSSKPQKLNIEFLGLRFYENTEKLLTFVIGMKVQFTCNFIESTERILLKLIYQNKKIEIADIGFQ